VTRRCSRGETSAQTVIVLPALLLMLWTGVHVALLLHSANVAAAVADAVARQAAAFGGSSSGDLAALADSTARELSGDLVGAPEVLVADGSVTVTVTVRGPAIVPFLPEQITRSSTAPLERFLTAEQRR